MSLPTPGKIDNSEDLLRLFGIEPAGTDAAPLPKLTTGLVVGTANYTNAELNAALGGGTVSFAMKTPNAATSSARTGTTEAIFSTGSQSLTTEELNRVGAVIEFEARILVTGSNGADTQTFAIRLGGVGGTVIHSTGPVGFAADDIVFLSGRITVRTTGATGTIVAGGRSMAEVSATAAAVPWRLASTTVDLTANAVLCVTADASSANAGNTAVLEDFHVRVIN
jgi:hypothetical protein